MTSFLEILGIAAAITMGWLGYRLYSRFGAAINYSGIGRPYPIFNSVLAFLGIGLIVAALCVAGGILLVTFY